MCTVKIKNFAKKSGIDKYQAFYCSRKSNKVTKAVSLEGYLESLENKYRHVLKRLRMPFYTCFKCSTIYV